MVLIVKIWLKGNFLKIGLKHIENNFLGNKFIQVAFGFDDKALECGFFVFGFPEPLDMGCGK